MSEDIDLREQPWFNFLQPWEHPQRGWGYRRARRRWRQRHERIFWLERDLGYIDLKWELCEVFPWKTCWYDHGW